MEDLPPVVGTASRSHKLGGLEGGMIKKNQELLSEAKTAEENSMSPYLLLEPLHCCG